MKKRKRLFDVVFNPPKLKIVRVRALEEDDAADIAVELFETGTTVKNPDRRRRTVYEWKHFKGIVPVTARRRATK